MADGTVRVVVAGVAGRMGGTLVRLISQTPGLQVCGGTERAGSPLLGKDGGGFTVVEDLGQAIRQGQGQVVIDFTSPDAAAAHARACAEAGAALVVGTTGLGAEVKEELARAAKRVPVVQSPNMSVGVNVMFKVAAELARVLGPGFDVEIVEAHHRMKKDAPSGTALKLAEEVASALGRGPESLRFARHGQVGERPRPEIGVQALRGGDVVGEHTVFFFGDGERLELTHRASSREQFAQGALRAAAWVAGRAPGLYDMADVLGLKGGGA
ncbi:MAG TPA: 4-hydroxy-tetrahydrodipicolinate reductase [Myxococcales bacterium]|nr:4-hydroxy-tetrahydrodipicolinate reductase [Myxococcales bacterium]